MIEAIFIVVNGSYAYSRQYAQQADPTMLSGLLTALRFSSYEVSRGDFRQAQFGESQVIFESIPQREDDFIAIFATPTEVSSDLSRLSQLISEAFIERYSDRLSSWTSLDGPFDDFQSTVDQIVAGGIWQTTRKAPQTPHVDFAYSFSLAREPLQVGDTLTVNFSIQNSDAKPVTLSAIGNAVPESHFAVHKLGHHVLLRGTIFLHQRKLKPDERYNLQVELKTRKNGVAKFAPILHGVQSTRPFILLGPHRGLIID